MTPQEASKKYHWVKYDDKTKTIDLFLDHYMLSGLRICESRFFLDHITIIKPDYSKTTRKPWFFDYGEYIHWCLEVFYGYYKEKGQPPLIDWWMTGCKCMWKYMKMDEYGDEELVKNGKVYLADYNKYIDLKGKEQSAWTTVCGLLTMYYAFYMDMRLRIIDTEITFGHNKEVPIGSFEISKTYYQQVRKKLIEKQQIFKVNCFLTGRIDLLVDNGYKIGPIDHKNAHKFDGDEHNDYNPNDAICGYILACNEIIRKLDKDLYNKRPPLSAWIQHISACHPSQPRDKTKQPGPRFKTTPIDKTPVQLQSFKERQITTFKRVSELLFLDSVPQWNTIMCNNIFHRPCEYRLIHRSPESEWVQIIKSHYTIGINAWDTRNYGHQK